LTDGGVVTMNRRGYASVIWGGLLIILGLVLLAQNLDLLGGLGASLWSVFFGAGGLLFLVIYLGDRKQRWALIPGLALFGIAGAIFLSDQGLVPENAVASIVLAAIALPFFLIFLSDREQWWALIPSFTLAGSAAGVFLEGAGLISDETLAAVIIGGVSTGFLVIYLIDRKQWWALIPGGIMAIIAFFMLLATTAEYIWPLAIIVLGLLLLRRAWGGVRRQAREEEYLSNRPSPEPYDDLALDEYMRSEKRSLGRKRQVLPTLDEQIAAAIAEEPDIPTDGKATPDQNATTEEPEAEETEPTDGDAPSPPKM
jgi:hypothetical protein